jgi:hypothetical protein
MTTTVFSNRVLILLQNVLTCRTPECSEPQIRVTPAKLRVKGFGCKDNRLVVFSGVDDTSSKANLFDQLA